MARHLKQRFIQSRFAGFCFSCVWMAQLAFADTPAHKATLLSSDATAKNTVAEQNVNQQNNSQTTTAIDPSENAEIDAYGPILKPYRAKYTIFDGKDRIGEATRKLSKSNELWTLQQFTSMSKWFYSYSFEESSQFTIKNNQLLPIEYQSLTKRSFKDNRIIKSRFDWESKRETGQQNKNRWTLDLPNAVLDHLSYQVALRSKASQQKRKETFRISYKGQLESYKFNNEGRETLTTEYGEIETVLWAQEPNFKHDKFMHIWLAPSLHYLPVKITQYRSDDKAGSIQLASVDWL